jgi:hypothetical protein
VGDGFWGRLVFREDMLLALGEFQARMLFLGEAAVGDRS